MYAPIKSPPTVSTSNVAASVTATQIASAQDPPRAVFTPVPQVSDVRTISCLCATGALLQLGYTDIATTRIAPTLRKGEEVLLRASLFWASF